jgi:hypothetical protein
LSITSVTLSGANSTDFSETNTCGSGIAMGATCSISVTFTPAAPGSRSASISIADNANGSPQTISLSGTGTSVPTPAGNYFVQVNASLGNDEHTLTIPVTVQ